MLSANLHADSFREISGLPKSARLFLILLVVSAHILLAWMLLQIPAVRSVLVETAPIFVYMIKPAMAEPVPEITKPPEPPPVIKKPKPKKKPLPVVEKPVIQEQVIEKEPIFVEPMEAPPVVAAAPVIAPKAPTTPKLISVSAVRYQKAPTPVYPMASKRLKETGEALVRVLIDQNGVAQRWLIEQSSGSERLDEAAIAAIKKASFYPYMENGQPLPVWAVIPISFNLR